MASLMGALTGAAIDRKDGDSGIKGAIIGSMATRFLGPIGGVLFGAWAVRRFATRKRPGSRRA